MPIDPGTAAIASAGIQAAGGILGGLFGGGKSGYQKQQEYWNIKNAELSHNIASQLHAERHAQITHRVADAKYAGIHPLYALGASANYSPSTLIPGQAATGSHKRDVLAGITDAAASAIRGQAKDPNDDLRTQLLKAQIRREEVETQAVASATARAERESNAKTAASVAQTFGWDENEAPMKFTGRKPQERSTKGSYLPDPVMGGRLYLKPGSVPAEAYENEYGEGGGLLFGIGRLVEDYLYNLYGSGGGGDTRYRGRSRRYMDRTGEYR